MKRDCLFVEPGFCVLAAADCQAQLSLISMQREHSKATSPGQPDPEIARRTADLRKHSTYHAMQPDGKVRNRVMPAV